MKRADLVKTLELLKPALAGTNLVPVYQCFMFNGKTVTATNDQIAIIAECKADAAFAVKGDILLGLLQNSRAEEVKFNLEDFDCHITASKSNFKLPYIPKDDFLFQPPHTKRFAHSLTIDSALLEGLQACLQTTSKDNTQPALMGVTLHHGDQLWSCDGDAVTRCNLKVDRSDGPDLLIPNAFCEALIKVAIDTDAKAGEFELDNEWAQATLDTGYTLYGRIAKVDKPLDHTKLVNDTLGKKPEGTLDFVPVPKGLNNALSRARVVADPESAKTVLTVDANKLKLVTETSVGVVRDSMPVAGHQPVTAYVSAAFVQRAISLCEEFAILENCTVYRHGDDLFQLLSNMN
jgi:DNA polymerase III sliding clamp (beta) subunit (PCNA family)